MKNELEKPILNEKEPQINHRFSRFFEDISQTDTEVLIDHTYYGDSNDENQYSRFEQNIHDDIDPENSLTMSQFANKFFEELLIYLKDQLQNQDEKQLKQSIAHIEMLFSSSPNMTDYLNWDDLFRNCAIYNRQNPAINRISSILFEHLAYVMEFTHNDEILQLDEKYKDESDLVKLDYLALIDKITQAVLSAGYADRTLFRLKDISEKMIASEQKPILSYATKITDYKIGRILRQENDPIPGTYEPDPSEEINTYSDEQNEHWEKRIITNPPLLGYKIIKVAKDCFSAVDGRYKPQYYSKIDPSTEIPEVGMINSSSNFERLIEEITPENLKRSIYLKDIISYISHQILNPHYGQKIEQTAEKWSEISNVLSEKDWQKLISNQEVIRLALEEIHTNDAQSYQKAEEENLEILQEYTEFVLGQIDQLELTGYPADLAEELRHLKDLGYSKLVEKKIEDLVHSINILEKFGREVTQAQLDFMTKCKSYEKQYEINWNKAKEKNEKFYAQKIESVIPDISSMNALLMKLTKKAEQFSADLQQEIEKIYNQEKSDLPILDFKPYEELPKDKQANPVQDEKDEVSLLIQHLHRPDMRYHLEARLGIKLDEINLNSQIQFLKFMTTAEPEEFSRVETILKKGQFGQEFIHSFLSASGDENFTDILLKISEEFPPEAAKSIFSKYSEIAGTTEQVRSFLQENFANQSEYNQELEEKIIQNLLKKGKDLLVNYAKTPEKTPEQVLSELEDINTEIILFATTFKTLKNNNENISLEDFQNYSVKSQPPDQISEEQKDVMRQILITNWLSQNQAITEYALSHLNNGLSNPNSKFYIMRFNNEIIGYQRFDANSDGSLDAGSFNIKQEARGSHIGEAALRTYLNQEAASHVIKADASPFIPIAKRYIGEFGFVATGLKQETSPQGETFLLMDMERNDGLNPEYQYISNHQKAQSEYQSNQYEPDQNQIILKFDQVDQQNQMLFELNQILSQGNHIMTAYFNDSENPNNVYLCFEKKIPTEVAASELLTTNY